MSVSELESELVRLASTLRPPGEVSVSVVEIAHRAGASVWLRVHTGSALPSAQIDLVQRPPKIVVYRPGRLNGERQVHRGEDGLLTARERFSVAHELGHWMALIHLKVVPQSKRKGGYWADEGAMNAFAGHLLAPDWLVSEWLKRTPEGHPVSLSDLQLWAQAQCRVSEEVLANALARRRRSIGFLKVCASRNAKRADVLKVLYSTAGEAVFLPHRSTHIQDSRLLKMVRIRASGAIALPQARLGKCEPSDLHIFWRRTGSARGTAWLSVSLPAECATCERPIFGRRPHFDDMLPSGAFCSRECRLEALLALGENVGYGSEDRFKELEPDPAGR